MKHAGKAKRAGLKLIFSTLVVAVIAVAVWSVLYGAGLTTMAAVLITIWILFALFSVNFFRDPHPQVPSDPQVILAPAHGTVDVIDEIGEKQFIGGPCRRISFFLLGMDGHGRNSPLAG